MTLATDVSARPRPRSSLLPLALVAMFGVAVVGLAATMGRTSYDTWAAFWVAPVLILLTVPMANRAARREQSPRLGRLILGAAALKVVVGSIARYWMEADVYGSGDSNQYHYFGAQLAPLFRRGIYHDLGEVSGTRFTEILTGHVYALIGPSHLAGFMVFSWLAFVGLYFFWRAFRIAVPEGDNRRYLVLLLFFPTLFFWTSATGKDAWMVLCLGVAAYGLALLLTGRVVGVIGAGLGLWGAAVVRPHLPLIFLVAAAVALPMRLLLTGRGEAAVHRRGARVVLLLFVVAAATLALARAQDFFSLDRLDVESAESVTARVEGNTEIGGSAYEGADPNSPMGYAVAAVTVIFRPLPTEAHNVQSLIAAAEGLVLFGLLAASGTRLARLSGALFRSPYLLFSVAFTAAFVYAFASVQNFGILARQRSQLLPVFFVLVSLTPPVRRPARSERQALPVSADTAAGGPKPM